MEVRGVRLSEAQYFGDSHVSPTQEATRVRENQGKADRPGLVQSMVSEPAQTRPLRLEGLANLRRSPTCSVLSVQTSDLNGETNLLFPWKEKK